MVKTVLCVICVVTVLGLTADIAVSQDAGDFSKEIVLSVQWGAEPGEVGKISDMKSQIPGGPSSLDIDSKNNIYLLDSGNKRVLIYDDQGELSRYIALNTGYYYGSSLIEYCEEKDAVITHNQAEKIFTVYSGSGEFLQRIHYNEDIGPYFTVESNRIIGACGFIPIDITSRSNTGDTRIVLHDSELEKQFAYGGKYTGTMYVHEMGNYAADNDRYTIQKPDNTTQVFELKEVPPEYTSYFVFETAAGEPVFMAGQPNDTTKPTVFVKYDKNMQLLSKIEEMDMIKSTGYIIEQPYKFYENGDIYTLKLNDNGATITRYVF